MTPVIAWWAALAAQAEPTLSPPAEAPAVIETIDESTVGDLEGTRVPMANMSQRAYVRADGTTAEGWTCTLVLASGPVVAGVGSAIDVAGGRWEVTAVAKEPGQPGSVTLRRTK